MREQRDRDVGKSIKIFYTKKRLIDSKKILFKKKNELKLEKTIVKKVIAFFQKSTHLRIGELNFTVSKNQSQKTSL